MKMKVDHMVCMVVIVHMYGHMGEVVVIWWSHVLFIWCYMKMLVIGMVEMQQKSVWVVICVFLVIW